MKRLFLLLILSLSLAIPASAADFMPWNLRIGSPYALDMADVAYDGIIRAIPADTDNTYPRLRDMGRGRDDNGVLYSGQMLNFDGVDDHITVSGPNFDPTTVTMAATITFEDAGVNDTIVEMGFSGGSACALGIKYGKIVCSYYDGSDYTMKAFTASAGTIYRVVGVVSSGTTYLYVDTVSKSESSTSLGLDLVSTNIGCRSQSSQFHNGYIGNLQIWNAAWDANDVAYDYANPETPAYNRPDSTLTAANLKGWWPLIEGSGGIAYDWSGNGNHGTLTNFTLPTAWENADALSNPKVMQTCLMEWGLLSGACVPVDTAGATNFLRTHNELNFNGRSFINCGSGPDVNPSNALIIEGVFSYNDTIIDSAGYILSHSNLTYRIYPYYGSSIYLNIKDIDGNAWNTRVLVAAFPESEKHHLIAVYSVLSNLLEIYVDGVKSTQTGTKPPIYKNFYNLNGYLNLGSYNFDSYLLGQLPQLEMYIDDDAQKIIDGGLDAWVAKQYTKAAAKYGLQ